MQPTFGRFHSVRNASGGLLFARLTNSSILDVLVTDVAFRASLSDSEHPAKVRGRKGLPSLELLALLLAVPSTTASLLQDGELLKPSNVHPRKDVNLQLRCRDRSGVELVMTTAVQRIPAKRILEEMHESLFSAIVALEATVRDAGGEKHSSFLDEKQMESPTLETIKTSLVPLVIRGQPVEAQAVFRRAAAADARMQGNRAFVVANAAARVRTEILEQRRARKEAEMLKKKRERELLRAAKRKHEMMKAAKGKPVTVAKRRKKSLFAVPEEEVENAHTSSKSIASILSPASAQEKDVGPRKFGSQEDVNSIQPEKGTDLQEKKDEESVEARNSVVKKEEDVPMDEVEPAPSVTKPPLLKRKKKKKIRSLV